MAGILVPLTDAPVSRLIDIAEECVPFVRPRTESDYWLYGRLFSGTCRAVVDEGIVAGFVVAFRGQDDPFEIYIQDVAVSSASRRRGHARRLVEDVVRTGRRLGTTRVWLTSEPENAVARATWTAMGFANPPADRLTDGVWVTDNLKGPGKDRAVFEIRLS